MNDDFAEPKLKRGECFGCIREGICYSEDDKVGWCDNCSTCRQKDCPNKIKYRIHWSAGSKGEFNLYRDVCEQHSEETDDCPCSSTSTVSKKSTYIYFS